MACSSKIPTVSMETRMSKRKFSTLEHGQPCTFPDNTRVDDFNDCAFISIVSKKTVYGLHPK